MSLPDRNLEERLKLLTQLAQQAVDQSAEQARRDAAHALTLQKISSTQDSIADRLDRGQAKMDDHELRLRDLERERLIDETRRRAIGGERKKLVSIAGIVFHIGRGVGVALWAAGAAALAWYLKDHR